MYAGTRARPCPNQCSINNRFAVSSLWVTVCLLQTNARLFMHTSLACVFLDFYIMFKLYELYFFFLND